VDAAHALSPKNYRSVGPQSDVGRSFPDGPVPGRPGRPAYGIFTRAPTPGKRMHPRDTTVQIPSSRLCANIRSCLRLRKRLLTGFELFRVNAIHLISCGAADIYPPSKGSICFGA